MSKKVAKVKMAPKWKEIWIQALRGQINDKFGRPFKQGRILLCNANREMCCLGVLAELQEPGIFEAGGKYSDVEGEFGLSRRTSHLAEGLEAGLTHVQMDTLARLNDGYDGIVSHSPKTRPRSFKQIAAYIERYL